MSVLRYRSIIYKINDKKLQFLRIAIQKSSIDCLVCRSQTNLAVLYFIVRSAIDTTPTITTYFRTTEGYPLKIEATNVVVEESTMDSVLVSRVLNKLNYPALVAAIADVRNLTPSLQSTTTSTSTSSAILLSKAPSIPSEPPKEGDTVDESTLKAFHFFLFDVHVVEGILLCPDTGRKFPIKDGIPNMILHEDEV